MLLASTAVIIGVAVLVLLWPRRSPREPKYEFPHAVDLDEHIRPFAQIGPFDGHTLLPNGVILRGCDIECQGHLLRAGLLPSFLPARPRIWPDGYERSVYGGLPYRCARCGENFNLPMESHRKPQTGSITERCVPAVPPLVDHVTLAFEEFAKRTDICSDLGHDYPEPEVTKGHEPFYNSENPGGAWRQEKFGPCKRCGKTEVGSAP